MTRHALLTLTEVLAGSSGSKLIRTQNSSPLGWYGVRT